MVSPHQHHAESGGNFVKESFLIRNVWNLMKSHDLDMSGPAKASPGGPGGDKSLSTKPAFTFFSGITAFLFIYNFIIFYKIISLLNKFIIFTKSFVLLNKFIMFLWKRIIGFTWKIYHFYKTISFTKRTYHFYKIISFTKRIYHFW